MKSQKTRLLLVVLGLFIATSSLMIVFATSELNIKSDLANAVQHIEKIIFRENMESEEVEEVTFTNKKNFARINTTGYNVVINNNSDNENKINRLNTEGNTILGGEGNTITSDSKHNVIIAGKNNRIEESSWAVIGGGINNTIKGESHRSVIAGGSGNVVTGRYSSIPGGENNSISGDYSVAMGVNNVVIGDASAALGSGSKIEANNSFLWTDRSHNDVLETDNTFAIVSNKGLVVNGKLPHSYAKLTIGGSGSLVIREGTEVACDANTKGVMKAVENGDSTCLCSCNGTSWTSLNGGTVCGNACDPLGTSNPKCGNVTKICGDEGGHYVYSGTCVIGKVIDGTGAYFLDKKGKVHRSCQNENGTVTQCEKEPTNDGCDIGARNHCDFSTIVENHIFRTCNTGFVSDNIIEGQLFDNSQLDYVCGPGGVLCAKVCDAGYGPVTEDGMQGCQEKACESREISGYIFPGVPGGADSDATKEGTTTDGSYSCYGIARCELGEFVIPLEVDECTYTCNAGEYSGYELFHSFVGGSTQTGSRSYESGGLTYDCNAKFVCNNGIVDMLEEECIPNGGGCSAMEINGFYTRALENGEGDKAFKTIEGLSGSCELDYWCYNNEFHYIDQGCKFECTGNRQSTEVAYNGPSIFTDINRTPKIWTHVTSQTLRACEYRCKDNISWSESEGCYVEGCLGSVPNYAHPNNTLTPSANKNYYYYDGTDKENKVCTYSCDDSYSWNASVNKCVKCSGEIPDNAHSNNSDLPQDIMEYQYSVVTDKVCTYSCDDGYIWNPSTNECVYPNPVNEPECKKVWKIPVNGHMNNEYLPSVDTDYYFSENENEPCTYSCNAGFTGEDCHRTPYSSACSHDTIGECLDAEGSLLREATCENGLCTWDCDNDDQNDSPYLANWRNSEEKLCGLCEDGSVPDDGDLYIYDGDCLVPQCCDLDDFGGRIPDNAVEVYDTSNPSNVPVGYQKPGEYQCITDSYRAAGVPSGNGECVPRNVCGGLGYSVCDGRVIGGVVCHWAGTMVYPTVVGFKCNDGYYQEGCDCVKSECNLNAGNICKSSGGVFDRKSCECLCQDGYQFDYTTQKCEKCFVKKTCPEGYVLNDQRTACVFRYKFCAKGENVNYSSESCNLDEDRAYDNGGSLASWPTALGRWGGYWNFGSNKFSEIDYGDTEDVCNVNVCDISQCTEASKTYRTALHDNGYIITNKECPGCSNYVSPCVDEDIYECEIPPKCGYIAKSCDRGLADVRDWDQNAPRSCMNDYGEVVCCRSQDEQYCINSMGSFNHNSCKCSCPTGRHLVYRWGSYMCDIDGVCEYKDFSVAAAGISEEEFCGLSNRDGIEEIESKCESYAESHWNYDGVLKCEYMGNPDFSTCDEKGGDSIYADARCSCNWIGGC